MGSSAPSQPNIGMVPLGLFSLGGAIFTLSGFLFGSIPSLTPFVGFGLFVGGLGMLITGYWAFREGLAFGGVAFSSVGCIFAAGAFWAWLFGASSKDPGAEIGWQLLAASVVLFFLAISSFNEKFRVPKPGALMWSLLFLTIFVDWIGIAFHIPGMLRVAGVIGILTAIMAWIGGFVALTSM